MREPIPIDGEGRFAGYASAFGLVDESGDVVMPGAFAMSLARRGRKRLARAGSRWRRLFKEA